MLRDPDGRVHERLDRRDPRSFTTRCEHAVLKRDVWYVEDLAPCDDAVTCLLCMNWERYRAREDW